MWVRVMVMDSGEEKERKTKMEVDGKDDLREGTVSWGGDQKNQSNIYMQMEKNWLIRFQMPWSITLQPP